jgi:hypothetical protein
MTAVARQVFESALQGTAVALQLEDEELQKAMLEEIEAYRSATARDDAELSLYTLLITLQDGLPCGTRQENDVAGEFGEWAQALIESEMPNWSPNPKATPPPAEKAHVPIRLAGVHKLAEFVPRFAEGDVLPIAFILTGFSDLYNYYAHVMIVNNKAVSATLTIPKSKFKQQGVPLAGYYSASIDTKLRTYKDHPYYAWTYKFGGLARDTHFDEMLKIYVEDVLIQFNHGTAHTFSHFWKGTDEIDLQRFYKLAQQFGFKITDYKPSFEDGRDVLKWDYTDE